MIGYKWNKVMKARIKKTGEIVDIYHESQHGTPKMIYKESVLVNSRMWIEDELELLNEEYDHWQDVRERTAISAIQGILSCGDEWRDFSIDEIAKVAVEYGDALVRELKR